MGKPPHRASRQGNRKKKRRQPFLEKGLTALVMGFGFWMVSLVLSDHPLLGAAGRAVQTPAWLAMGVGVLLLGIHHVLKDRASDDAGHSSPHRLPPSRTVTPGAPPMSQASTAIWRTADPEPARAHTTTTTTTPPALTAWSPAVFKAIEWRRFEAVCEALFAQAGFEARTQSHGPDGGVDVWLHSKHVQGGGPASVVQCKHWRSKPVGVKEVREFFGVMASHQLKRGTYATTSSFTGDAVDFAQRNRIHLLDGAGLLKLIAQRTPEQQQALLAVAFEGDYARPTCASCGTKMVERQPSKGGSTFWGCVSYPRCRSTMVKTA